MQEIIISFIYLYILFVYLICIYVCFYTSPYVFLFEIFCTCWWWITKKKKLKTNLVFVDSFRPNKVICFGWQISNFSEWTICTTFIFYVWMYSCRCYWNVKGSPVKSIMERNTFVHDIFPVSILKLFTYNSYSVGVLRMRQHLCFLVCCSL